MGQLVPNDGAASFRSFRLARTGFDWRRLVQVVGTLAALWTTWTTVADDPMRAYFWIGGPLVVALGYALVAAFRGTRAGGWSGLVTSILVLVLAAVVMRLGTPKSDLMNVGDKIILSLDNYRRDHGTYPESLGDAGIRPAWNRFGGWNYRSRDGGSQWDLWIGGDVTRLGGFVYYISSQTRQWGYDDG